MEVEEGWEVSDGPVWFEGEGELIRVENAPSIISGVQGLYLTYKISD